MRHNAANLSRAGAGIGALRMMANREAARAFALALLGRDFDRVRIPGTPAAGALPESAGNVTVRGHTLTPADQDAFMHLAACAGAHRGRRYRQRELAADLDFRAARAIRLSPDHTLTELDRLVRSLLAERSDLLTAFAAELLARGTLDASQVRRTLLRARLQ